jgi:2-C-methyl-D-erythritol 4-phosphate cytidylyltransferase
MTVALIVAAGRGERLQAGGPKALVELGGQSMLSWSIEALSRVEAVGEIVVALPEGVAPPPGVRAVLGGATRSQSVRNALAAVAGDPVLVHDAARPLLSPELARDVISALENDPEAAAAIAAIPVTDTIKRVQEGGVVAETLQRSGLWAVQTPQVFRRGALERALAVSAELLARATDDASLVEQAGGRVIVVGSSAENLKVTTPLDLEVAEMLLARRRAGG